MGNSLGICKDVTYPADLDFSQFYNIGDIIGMGGFGEVCECVAADDDDCTKYAVKLIDKERVILQSTSAFWRKMSNSSFSQSSFQASTRRLMAKDEVDILKQISHPCIVGLLDFFEDKKFIYVVMEKIDGGQLFDRLSKDMSQVFESDIANAASQMFSAIEYLHRIGIVHRDVKAENILLVDGAPERKEANRAETGGAFGTIKLIDFGFACFMHQSSCIFSTGSDETPLTFFCGSLPYLAPEILLGHYGKKVDVWAAGVVLYLMLFAAYPYYCDDDPEETERLICTGEPPAFKCQSEGAIWCYDWQPSRMVRQFILLLFQKDVKKRPSANRALRHDWIQNGGCEEDESVSPELPLSVRTHLKKFARSPPPSSAREFDSTRTLEEKTSERSSSVQNGRHRPSYPLGYWNACTQASDVVFS